MIDPLLRILDFSLPRSTMSVYADWVEIYLPDTPECAVDTVIIYLTRIYNVFERNKISAFCSHGSYLVRTE